MGFISRNWSGEIEASGSPLLNEVTRPPKIVPIPISGDDGRTLDWSQPQDGEGMTPSPFVFSPTIQCERLAFIHDSEKGTDRKLLMQDERKLSKLRLSMLPATLEAAARVAIDLQRRYDMLFLHLETSKPVLLTAVVRWAASAPKIPAQSWKAPIPTIVMEEYISESAGKNGVGSNSTARVVDWKPVVDDFIAKCDELDQRRGRRWSGLPPVGDQPRRHSRATSRASSISEGHVSPDDDGPSRKVVHHDE